MPPSARQTEAQNASGPAGWYHVVTRPVIASFSIRGIGQAITQCGRASCSQCACHVDQAGVEFDGRCGTETYSCISTWNDGAHGMGSQGTETALCNTEFNADVMFQVRNARELRAIVGSRITTSPSAGMARVVSTTANLSSRWSGHLNQ